ncbi:MAG: ATPase domain-containing protein [Candidatus Jordarchaeales archaeon]
MSKRVPTGIPEFDALIEGGFPKPSIVVLSGNPGAGKTIFSAKFIYEGAQRYGEPGVYVCLAESRDKFLSAMKRFGMEFEPLMRRGLVTILDLSLGTELHLQAALNQILEAVTSINAKRLVIDSLTALLAGVEKELERRHLLRLIYKLCRKTDCTAIIIVDMPFGHQGVGSDIEFIADGVIYMESIYQNGTLKRRLRVLKMRETAHSLKIHSYVITKEGIKLEEQQPQPTGSE